MVDATDSKSVVREDVWVRVPPPVPTHYQRLTTDNEPQVDAVPTVMESPGDNLVTTRGEAPACAPPGQTEPKPDSRAPKAGKNGKPVATVKYGSASVPIYRCRHRSSVRFILSYHRAGKRVRQSFTSLVQAKKEALLVARRIQSGLQHVTDMTPADRDAYTAARRLLDASGTGMPLVAAVEDYLRARAIAGTESLAAMAADYSKYFRKVVRKASVPEVVKHLLESKEQDGTGARHRQQLRSVLNRFAARFPGPILDVTTAGIEQWLGEGRISPSTRNSLLRHANMLFSFALAHDYLPEGRATATAGVRKAKVVGGDVSVFAPEQMRKILHAAPPHLVPILSIGAFAGIRMAELARLDWSAIDLERRIIEVRAGQAKTASRRVIPVAGNLAAWLAPLPRRGKVIPSSEIAREATALAKSLGIAWPRNVLRHSFISYRIAIVKSADQVALEAGNSPSIIFRHYRELVTEETADEWFSIRPEEGR